MNTEFADNRVSQSLIAEPDEDFAKANPTTRIRNLDQEISLGLFLAWMRRSTRKPTKGSSLRSIGWRSLTKARMIFRSTDMDQIDAFSKKLRAIFAENEEANIVREFSLHGQEPTKRAKEKQLRLQAVDSELMIPPSL